MCEIFSVQFRDGMGEKVNIVCIRIVVLEVKSFKTERLKCFSVLIFTFQLLI